MIHTSSYVGGTLEYGIKYGLIETFFNVLVRFAVPIFFIISGTLLLNKKECNYYEFYKKRFIKIIIPFILWSIFYEFINNIYFNKPITILVFLMTLFQIIYSIIYGFIMI